MRRQMTPLQSVHEDVKVRTVPQFTQSLLPQACRRSSLLGDPALEARPIQEVPCWRQETKDMKTIDLTRPADLYLGTDHVTARAQGHRHFSNAFAAIRFAMEQAAPVSLRGAMLRSGNDWLDGNDIRAVYGSDRRFARHYLPEVAALNAA